MRTSDPALWEVEYKRGGLPSSLRTRPSNVTIDFVKELRRSMPDASTILDVGCGTGRNAVYLAEQGFSVKAIDYCATQIEALQTFVAVRPGLSIESRVGDVTQPWPWVDGAAQAAIDCFCFKHQIETAAITTYIAELKRCLVPGGLFMLFLATRTDGYYGQFDLANQYGVGQIIVDPGNGIASRLYSRVEIEGLFQDFETVHFAEKNSTNVMHGETYKRCSAVWYLRKR